GTVAAHDPSLTLRRSQPGSYFARPPAVRAVGGGRRDTRRRDIPEEAFGGGDVEGTDARSDRTGDGVHVNGREPQPPQERTLFDRDALHARRRHDRQVAPDRTPAQQHDPREEGEAVASPREPAQHGTPPGRGGERVVAALAREPG